MSKVATLFTLALLLSFNLIHASRPIPALKGALSLHEDVAASKAEIDDESCEEETEECLTRRTLLAHLDYIYTQKHKPKP
ncbi:Phytosulfokines 3, partial [Mucuna pruriens]